MNKNKIIDVVVYTIFIISVCIELYYLNYSNTKAGLVGLNYCLNSILGFGISILFLIIYWLVRYVNKIKKK